MLLNTIFILSAVTSIMAFDSRGAAAGPRLIRDDDAITHREATDSPTTTTQAEDDRISLLYQPPLDPSAWVAGVGNLPLTSGPICVQFNETKSCTLFTLRDPVQKQIQFWIYDNNCNSASRNLTVGLPVPDHTDLATLLNYHVVINEWHNPAFSGPLFLYAGDTFGWEFSETWGYNAGKSLSYPHTIVATRQIFDCSKPK